METEELVGRQVDQYHITSLLARGGMAEVYVARDVDLDREVILKVMLSTLVQDKSFVARFRREARTTAQLNHPNIIQVYGAGFTPAGRPYLAMQYVRGGSLQDWLVKLNRQGKRLATADTLSIIRQIADALHAAHRAGIVHRDLKPSNILLHPNGTPVLTDLGIAAVKSEMTRLTQTGSVMGTPHYMSPEQALGKPVDGRSDIYALGIILYELLAGQAPFTADSPLAVLHQHVHESPRPLLDARPDLNPLTFRTVEVCLQKDPADRFQTAEQLVVALQNASLEERGKTPTAVMPYPTPAPTQKTKPERQLWPWIAAAAAVLVVGVGLAYGFLRDNGTTAPSPTPIPTANMVIVTTVATPIVGPTALPVAQPTTDTADTAVPPTPIPPTATPIPVPTDIPAIITGNVAAIRLASPPTIDGDLSDWPAGTAVLSAYDVFHQDSWDGSNDADAYWRLGWDAANLYIAVTVLDNIHVQIKSDEKIYQGDSIEMQFDTDLNGDYNTLLSPDDFQLNMSPGDFQSVPTAFYLWQGNDGRYTPAAWQGIMMASRPLADGGYIIEAVIPWRNFSITPASGMRIGLALNVSDNDSVGTAVQEMMKSNVETRTYEAPYTWGTLTLQ